MFSFPCVVCPSKVCNWHTPVGPLHSVGLHSNFIASVDRWSFNLFPCQLSASMETAAALEEQSNCTYRAPASIPPPTPTPTARDEEGRDDAGDAVTAGGVVVARGGVCKDFREFARLDGSQFK